MSIYDGGRGHMPRASADVDGSAIVGVTRTAMSASAELLCEVVAIAADDCRTALKRNAEGRIKPRDLALAASACRFFLSQDGEAVMMASGLGCAAVKAGRALARTTMDRLNLHKDEILADNNNSWTKVVQRESLEFAPTMKSKLARYKAPAFALVA